MGAIEGKGAREGGRRAVCVFGVQRAWRDSECYRWRGRRRWTCADPPTNVCAVARGKRASMSRQSASDLRVRLVRVWYLCPMRLCAVIQNPDNVEEMCACVCAEVAPPDFAEPADGPQIGHVSWGKHARDRYSSPPSAPQARQRRAAGVPAARRRRALGS